MLSQELKVPLPTVAISTSTEDATLNLYVNTANNSVVERQIYNCPKELETFGPKKIDIVADDFKARWINLDSDAEWEATHGELVAIPIELDYPEKERLVRLHMQSSSIAYTLGELAELIEDKKINVAALNISFALLEKLSTLKQICKLPELTTANLLDRREMILSRLLEFALSEVPLDTEMVRTYHRANICLDVAKHIERIASYGTRVYIAAGNYSAEESSYSKNSDVPINLYALAPKSIVVASGKSPEKLDRFSHASFHKVQDGTLELNVVKGGIDMNGDLLADIPESALDKYPCYKEHVAENILGKAPKELLKKVSPDFIAQVDNEVTEKNLQLHPEIKYLNYWLAKLPPGLYNLQDIYNKFQATTPLDTKVKSYVYVCPVLTEESSEEHLERIFFLRLNHTTGTLQFTYPDRLCGTSLAAPQQMREDTKNQ